MVIFMPPPWRRARAGTDADGLAPSEKAAKPGGLDGFCKPLLPPGTAGAQLLRGRRRRVERARVHRADEGNDSPQIVAGLDDVTEGRHGTHYSLGPDTGITLLLQINGAQGDQAEQRVVVPAVHPGVVGERRTHAAATAAAMATIAARGEVSMVSLFGDGGDVGIVGVLQLAFRRAGDEIARGRGGPEHGTAGAGALRLVCSARGRNRVGAKRRRIGRRCWRSVVVVVGGAGFPHPRTQDPDKSDGQNSSNDFAHSFVSLP